MTLLEKVSLCSQLTALPELAMPCGKTNLTLHQVRAFNEAQRLEYEVHKSDCRSVSSLNDHYIGIPRDYMGSTDLHSADKDLP